MLQLNTQRLYTVNEVAHILKVSPRTVQRRIRDGLLPATKPAGGLEWRIAPADLSAYVQGDTTPTYAAQTGTTQTTHYRDIDIEHEIGRRIDAIAHELTEAGSTLEPKRVFWLECLGYMVDLETGMVTEAQV